MKKVSFFLLLFSFLTTANAQVATISSSDLTGARLIFSTPDMSVDTSMVDGMLYSQLQLPEFVNSGVVGEPALPVYNRTIEIPLGAHVRIEVISANKQVVSAASIGMMGPLIPQQPSQRKSDTTAAIWVYNRDLYATDTFCGNPVVQVHNIGVSRDRNLAVLSYSPLRYNPATAMLEVFSQVEVALYYDGADVAATREMQQRYHSGAFAPQTDLLLTLPTGKSQNYAESAPIRYLIVCYSGFRGQMDAFVNWKRRKGFLTDIVYTDDPAVGSTATSIAAYIKSQYTYATAENPAPTYLLLVGDVEQIPAFNASNQVDNGHITDLYYATWTEGDFLPDCYYGRFSAQNVNQLTPQVSKTLLYEQYGFSDPTYLSRAILIAGVDAGYSNDNGYRYGDPAMDYVAKEYIKSANGFNSVVYYKNNTSFAPSGVVVTGSSNDNSTADSLLRRYYSGAGWVNYTAHGSETSWAEPELRVSDVNGLLNYGKPMFVIGNCCLTNHFNTSTCLGEAFLRRGNNAGAVSYIGGSNSTYWQEDFCWTVGVRSNISNTMNASYSASNLGVYDLLFHTHGESVPSWRTSAGAIISAGNMAVQNLNANSTMVKYYWEIYHVMGDPSLEPWLGEAEPMPLSVNTIYYRNSTPLMVTAVPYAYVALTDGNGMLISATFADEQGQAQLTVPITVPYGTYELAVTAQNYQPAFRPIRIVSLSGSALSVVSLQSDAPLSAGDTVTFSLQVANGSEVASSDFSLRCISNDLTQLYMLDNTDTLSTVAGNDTVLYPAVFRAVVSPQAIDCGRVMMTVQLVEGTDTSLYNTYVTLVAPNIVVVGYSLSATVEPGGMVSVAVTVRNDGHTSLDDASFSLLHSHNVATVLTQPYTHRSLVPNQVDTLLFDVLFGNDLRPSSNIPFLFLSESSVGTLNSPIMLGYAHVVVGDFETGDLSQINPSMNSHPWVVDSEETYEGDYSVRSSRSLSALGTSSMTFTYTCAFADSIRFFAKVSSESNGDWFFFSIDGETILSLSGEVDWERYSYPIEAGTHTFNFKYQKNWWRSSGSDAVWVDNIILPAAIKQTVYLADTVCRYSDYDFFGTSIATDVVGTQFFEHESETEVTYLSLTVLETPSISIEASTLDVVSGESVRLIASGATRYEWSTGDDEPVIQVTPTATSEYGVVGYIGMCSASSQITIRVLDGINEANLSTLHLYPNPTSDWVNVEVPLLNQLTVFDVSGRKMATFKGIQNKVCFSVKGWQDGVYFLRIETSNATLFRRIVVQ